MKGSRTNKGLGLGLVVISLWIASCGSYKEVSFNKTNNYKIIKMDNKEIIADLEIKVNNPNSMGFNIYRSKLDVNVNGQDLGKAKLTKRVHIARNSNEGHMIRVKLDVSKLSPSDLAKLSSRGATVSLDGNIKAGKLFYKKRFPVHIKEKISLGL